MYILDTTTLSWTKIDAKGDASTLISFSQFQVPSSRACHTLNRIGPKLYLFGGYNGSKCFNEIIEFRIDSKNWTMLTVNSNSPEPRNAHTMTTRGNQLILFGGHNGSKHLNDLWIFDIQEKIWTEIKTNGPPPKGLRGHTTNIIGNKLFVFGGYDGMNR